MAEPRPSRRARRAQEKLAIAKQARLDELELQNKQLTVTKKIDGYKEAKADRAWTRRLAATREARARLAARLKAFRTRLDNDRPLLWALAISSASFVAAISGQFMAYTSENWHGWGFLAYLLPFIVEGATWTFASYAQWLATRPIVLPYGSYIRTMWLFAAYAAAVNTYHVWMVLGDPVTGALLGGASLVGPFAWHKYVSLTRLSRKGMSAAQIRAAFLRWVFHPFLSLRARSLWSAADAVMTPAMAWRITWMNAYGAAPGTAPAGRVVTFRNRWLFRLIFGRVVTPTSATATRSATGGATMIAQPRFGEAQVAQPQLAAQPQPVDEVAQPTEAVCDPESDLVTDQELADVIARWSQLGESSATATDEPGATATLDRTEKPSSEQVAQPQPEGGNQVAELDAQPQPQPQPQPEAQPVDEVAQPKGATSPTADLIEGFYKRERAKGVAPGDVGVSLCRKFLRDRSREPSRQYVSRILGELRDKELKNSATATKSGDTESR